MRKYAGIIENDIVNSVSGINVSFWTQGCHLHCEGCHNKCLWSFEDGLDLPDDYIQKVHKLMNKNGVDRGLSILGGEPLAVTTWPIVRDLILSTKLLMPTREIYLWTGYSIEEIAELPYVDFELIKSLDYLITDRFDIKLKAALPLRGSLNQRVFRHGQQVEI